MSSSTASTGSKRNAVEDDDSRLSDETNDSKRLKPATKEEQKISSYFFRNDGATKTTRKHSHNAENECLNTRPEPPNTAELPKVSRRKKRSISPPASSRSEPAETKNLENEQVRRAEKSEVPALIINEHIGDIFAAPANALLIHACNCKGVWGRGIAAAFKAKYPAAFKIYKAHCNKPVNQLIGKSLLIPPQPGDRHQHYVGCVFTSVGFGHNVDPPDKILEATGRAVTDLLIQARSHIFRGKGDISEVRICKINSGSFKVDWEDTLHVLQTNVEPHEFDNLNVFSQ